MSTLACVHRVELDIGKQKLKKLCPSNVEFDSSVAVAVVVVVVVVVVAVVVSKYYFM